MEAFLVSLYGYRPTGNPPAGKQLSPDPLQTEASPDGGQSVGRDDSLTYRSNNLKRGGTAVRTDASLDLQTSNSSSSSSVAEDWIVNQNPAGLELNFSLCEDQSCSQTAGTGSTDKSPETLEDSAESAAANEGQLSAEDWSRGTALTDPVSGAPLQPVKILQPSKSNPSDLDEGRGSASRKTLNAITEKRAALTAYDLISNRATRAPLSPATLFEREARAEVLREKPAASLQDISAAVHERWKNLREEERKK